MAYWAWIFSAFFGQHRKGQNHRREKGGRQVTTLLGKNWLSFFSGNYHWPVKCCIASFPSVLCPTLKTAQCLVPVSSVFCVFSFRLVYICVNHQLLSTAKPKLPLLYAVIIINLCLTTCYMAIVSNLIEEEEEEGKALALYIERKFLKCEMFLSLCQPVNCVCVCLTVE